MSGTVERIGLSIENQAY